MARELHPIQLTGIRIAELSMKVRDPNLDSVEGANLPFQFFFGASKFDREESTVTIGVRGYVGVSSEDEAPFPVEIKVELFGVFEVDLSSFAEEHIEEWGKVNAPLLLMPFVREHVYGLAVRAGIRDLVVPLYIIPTFRVNAPAKALQ